jgi:hypothetical protein
MNSTHSNLSNDFSRSAERTGGMTRENQLLLQERWHVFYNAGTLTDVAIKRYAQVKSIVPLTAEVLTQAALQADQTEPIPQSPEVEATDFSAWEAELDAPQPAEYSDINPLSLQAQFIRSAQQATADAFAETALNLPIGGII